MSQTGADISDALFGVSKSKMRQELGNYERNRKKVKYKCLYPGCLQDSINSHSQQRGKQLKAISVDNSVYGQETSFYKMLLSGQESIEIVRTPIKNTSTFPGFCADHDNNLFSCIEKEDIKIGDPEQAGSLYLRALSYEYARKREAQAFFEFIHATFVKDKFVPLHTLDLVEGATEGIHLYFEQCGISYMDQVFEMHQNNDFSTLQSIWILMDGIVPISSCSCINPLSDNTHLFEKTAQPVFTLNMIPSEGGSFAIISYDKQFANHLGEIETLIKDPSKVSHLLNSLIFAESEDYYLSPLYWDTLSENNRELMIEAKRHADFRGPLEKKLNLFEFPIDDIVEA